MSEKNTLSQSQQDKIKNFADEELLYRLREFYKLYSETKKKYSLKFSNNPDGADTFLDVFFNNIKTIFLEDPDVQQKFFSYMVESLLAPHKPILANTHAEVLQKRIRKKVDNRGYPDKVRKILSDHYFRRINIIKQKKFKTMQRYAHFCKEQEKINYAENYITERMKVMDDELSILEQKYKRLKHDDYFTHSISNPANKVMIESIPGIKTHEIPADFDSSISSLSKDDIVCYLRDIVYHRKCSRLMKKISNNIKWIHYTKRFEIYKEANEKIYSIRTKNEDFLKKSLDMNKNLLINLLKDKNKFDQGCNYFVQELFHIQDENPLPYALTKYDYPPLIDACKTEVLNTLEELSKTFKLDFTESINMQAYLYKIENMFKIIFENQNELVNFFDNDQKGDLFAHYNAEKNRRKSLGEEIYSTDKVVIEQEKLKALLQSKDLVKTPHSYKIQPSEWLKELIFQRDIDTFELNTMQIMDNQKLKDPLLKNTIDLTDIQDLSNVKKFFLQKTEEQMKCGRRKIFNLVLNFRYFKKPKKEVIDRFMSKLADNKDNDRIKDAIYHTEFIYIDQKLKNRSMAFRRGEEYIDEICQIYDEEIENHTAILKYLSNANTWYAIKSKEIDFIVELSKINSKEGYIGLISNTESIDNFTNNQNPKSEDQKDQDKKTKYKHFSPRKGFLYVGKFLFSQSKTKEPESKDDYDSLICRLDQILYEINLNTDDDNFIDIDDINVVNDKGDHIIYDCVFGDIQKLEAEFVKIGSFYIDKFEKLPRAEDPSQQDTFLLADRMKVTYDLYELEKRYQFAKIRLIEEYFEIYENICDPLEQYKLISLILNLMEKRPVLDCDAFYFKDSYINEINIFKKKAKLLRQLKWMQIKEEIQHNKYFYEVAMKLSEMQNGFLPFQDYIHELLNIMKKKEKEFASDGLANQNHNNKPKNEESVAERDVEDIFEEMRRGSGENNNFKTENENMKEFVHENNNYSKNCMGGPHAILGLSTLSYVKYFPNGTNFCLIDFYMSLTNVTKILPLVDQVCDDYIKDFKTTDILQKSCTILIENIEGSPVTDDVGALEKIIQTVHTAVNGDKIDIEYIYKLDLNYVVSRIYSKPILSFKFDKEDHPTVGLPFQRHKELYLYCNMIEFHRLREEMISALYETKILEKIYLMQRRFAKASDDKSSMYYRHCLNFPTQSNSNVGLNVGEGSLIELFMKINEFDDMVRAHCNFMSPKCLSYMIIKDELECFRSAVKYEIVNKEIFIHQINLNKMLLDYPGKLEIEIDVLLSQTPYAFPNSTLDLDRIYAGNENVFNLKNKLRDVISIQKEKMKEITDWKKIGRPECERLYQEYELNASNQELEEIRAKRCRIYRKVLVNKYLDDLMISLSIDSTKFTLTDICKKIKDFIQIIPDYKKVFLHKKNPYSDLDNIFYADQKKFTGDLSYQDPKFTFFDEKDLIENIFYIPSEPEIVMIELTNTGFDHLYAIKNFDVRSYYRDEFAVFSANDTEIVLPLNTHLEIVEKDEYTKKIEEDEETVLHYLKKMINYAGDTINGHRYLNMKDQPIFKLVQYYNYMYDLLIKRLLITFLELSDEEILIINNLLHLNQVFPDYNFDLKAESNLDRVDQNNEDTIPEEHEDFGKSAFREVLAEKSTYKHMQVCMGKVKDYFKEFLERVRTEYKMMDLNNLLKYIRRETKFENNRTRLVMKNLLLDLSIQNPKTNYVKLARAYLNAFNHDLNINNLGLKFNYIIHCCKYKIHPSDIEKDCYTDTCNFKNFYSHIKKRYNDETITKLRTIINLNSIKIRRFLFKHENDKFKNTETKDKSNLHYHIKDIKLNQSSIYGTSNTILAPNIFYLISLLRKLDQKERLVMFNSIRQKDVELKDYAFYKTKKRELSALDYHKPMLLHVNFYNQLETLHFILRFWQRGEDFPDDAPRYVDSISELRELALKDVDLVRARIRYYQRHQVVLEIPKRYTPLFSQIDKIVSSKITAQDLTTFSETEMQLSHNVAEHICLMNMIEKSFMRDALLVIGEEYSAMTQFFHKYDEDSIKVALGKKAETNQYFCSTLVMKPKIKTNTINLVSEIHNKVYMVQSFINRLRNRASKINLLNSGIGYIIAASDLDECLAKLAKYIFDKSTIENINRDESYNLIRTHLNAQLEMKNQQIQYLESKVDYLQDNIEKIADTLLYQKGNALIFEMDAIVRDLYQVKDVIGRLEETLRDKIFKEVQDKIDNLKLELMIKDQKFKDFRLEVASFVKTEIKIGSKNISKAINKKIANALDIPLIDNDTKPNFAEAERENAEDIYLTTTLVNKLRTFYKIKEGLLKEKYEERVRDLEQKMQNYNEVYENLVETKKREFLLKKELLSVQRSLAYQEKMNQELKGKLQQLNYDRLRLERFKDSRGKKVEKLEEEIKELRIVQNIDVLKLLDEYQKKQIEIQHLKKNVTNFENYKLELEKINDVRLKLQKQELAKEIKAKQKILERLNEIQREMSPGRETATSYTYPDNYIEEEFAALKKRYDELLGTNQELNLENTKLKDEIIRLNQICNESKSGLNPPTVNLSSYMQIINNNKLQSTKNQSKAIPRDKTPTLRFLPDISKKGPDDILNQSTNQFNTPANEPRLQSRQNKNFYTTYGSTEFRSNSISSNRKKNMI